MKNNPKEHLRAELISTLWSLKTAISKHPNAIEGLGYVHFNTLIRDEDYRLSLIQAAAKSDVDEVREIGESALKIYLPGPLSKGSSDDLKQMMSGASPTKQTSIQKGSQEAELTTSRREKKPFFNVFRAVALFIALCGVTSVAISGWLWNSDVKIVEGPINESEIWHADTHYIINGLVFVESGATLSIEAGTQISGSPGSALIITRDAKINAQGSKNAPIVMTSSKAKGERHRGDWGGLVLLGNAPINKGNGHIEGISKDDPRGGYGGLAKSDSCGVLKFVRIEFAGYEISQNNELNGLTLGGCGSGTIISHVQVHMGLDDGVEVFGGNVNLKHVLITYPGDDGLDWDQGWQGKAQFVIVYQGSDAGDNGIEADNDKDDNSAQPRSNPTLSNISLIGSGNSNIAQRGLLLRRGTAGDLRNILITGFTTEAVDVGDQNTAALASKKELKANGWVIQQADKHFFSDEIGPNDDDQGFSESDWISATGNFLTPRTVLTVRDEHSEKPNFVPDAKSAAASIHVPLPQAEFWDEGANFAGAIRPGDRVSWLDEWTDYSVR